MKSPWYSLRVDRNGVCYTHAFQTAEEAHQSYVHATTMLSTSFAQYGHRDTTYSAKWSPF